MARMADAFMNGYSFVDNIQRQHKADDRLVTLQDRQDKQFVNQQADRKVRLADADVTRGRLDTTWQQKQDDRTKKQAEDKIYAEDTGKLFKLMTPAQLEMYEVGFSALPPEAQGEKGKAVIADAIMNPDKISKAIYSWDNNIVPAFKSGKMPDKVASLDVMNTVLYPELQARFAKNGLSGKLTDIVPSPGGKGLYFEAAVKDASGREYNAPITDGAGSANAPDSGSHAVQKMSVRDTMKHTADAVESYRSVLSHIVQFGGDKGIALGTKLMEYQIEAKTELAKYNRERRDKKSDAKEKFGYDKKLKEITASATTEAARLKNSKGTSKPLAASQKISIIGKVQEIQAKYKPGEKINPEDLTALNGYRGLRGLSPLTEREIKGKPERWWPGTQGVPDVWVYGEGPPTGMAAAGGPVVVKKDPEKIKSMIDALGEPADKKTGGMAAVSSATSLDLGPIPDNILKQSDSKKLSKMIASGAKGVGEAADIIIGIAKESSKGTDPLSLAKGAAIEISTALKVLPITRADRAKLDKEIAKRLRDKYTNSRHEGRTF